MLRLYRVDIFLFFLVSRSVLESRSIFRNGSDYLLFFFFALSKFKHKEVISSDITDFIIKLFAVIAAVFHIFKISLVRNKYYRL